MQKTLKNIALEYGATAVVVYLTIFALVLVGFWAALRFGWSPESTAGNVGAWAAAYIATKLTTPLRLAVTVVATPVVARLYERMVKKKDSAPPS